MEVVKKFSTLSIEETNQSPEEEVSEADLKESLSCMQNGKKSGVGRFYSQIF